MPQASSKPLNSFDRRHFIGGSDARIIMGQDEKALIRLWQEKRGEVGPEDLSANLIVQLGVVTEDLNRVRYERNTRHAITVVQMRAVAATLGGVNAAAMGDSLTCFFSSDGHRHRRHFLQGTRFRPSGERSRFSLQCRHVHPEDHLGLRAS